MFTTILVPLDGSAAAEAALPHAEFFARAFGGTLHLVRVIPMRQRSGAVPLDVVNRLDEAETHAYMASYQAGIESRGMKVRIEVTCGPPADGVIDAVRSSRAELVVLTSHGAGGCTDFPLGGTAQKVISCTNTSVLLVPVACRTAPADGATYRRVLVGVDGSQRCEQAVAAARELRRVGGAELVLGHVIRMPERLGAMPVSEEHHALRERLGALDRAAAEGYLTDLAARLGGNGEPVRTRLAAAEDVAPALVQLAASEDADLLVLAAHGTFAPSGWPYGAVAAQVMAAARRPVLIVQDQPPATRLARRRESARAPAPLRA